MREAKLISTDVDKQRIRLIREADRAWREYKATGASYDIKDAEAWLSSDRMRPAPWQRQ
jgi:hypothetical protein